MIQSSSVEPRLIQGGMGVAVSGWKLARAVALRGHLGVVSGTAIDSVLVRRLQDGDPDEDIRRALAEFPYPQMSQRILERYFIPQGKAGGQPYTATTMLPLQPSQLQLELVVVANFVEVFLAKEGHGGQVGINLLEKIQTPTLASLFGAMLADVDYVLMEPEFRGRFQEFWTDLRRVSRPACRFRSREPYPKTTFAFTSRPMSLLREKFRGCGDPSFWRSCPR